MAGHKSETGLYDDDSSAGLPGFKRGIMVDIFHISGILQVVSDKLKIEVRYSRPKLPKCFRWIVAILSGPNALDALAVLIASLVFSTVITTLSSLLFSSSLLSLFLLF